MEYKISKRQFSISVRPLITWRKISTFGPSFHFFHTKSMNNNVPLPPKSGTWLIDGPLPLQKFDTLKKIWRFSVSLSSDRVFDVFAYILRTFPLSFHENKTLARPAWIDSSFPKYADAAHLRCAKWKEEHGVWQAVQPKLSRMYVRAARNGIIELNAPQYNNK